jgi:hypothetical protein
MHRLQDLVRLHRLGTGVRLVARRLGMSPNTERTYRHALAAPRACSLAIPTRSPSSRRCATRSRPRCRRSSLRRGRLLAIARDDPGLNHTRCFAEHKQAGERRRRGMLDDQAASNRRAEMLRSLLSRN